MVQPLGEHNIKLFSLIATVILLKKLLILLEFLLESCLLVSFLMVRFKLTLKNLYVA